MGISSEEFTDTLIQGAMSGAFQIDKVGDAVKEFTLRSKNGSKTSADGFAALELDANEMFNTFARGGAGSANAFQEVISRLSQMKDPLAQNQAGVALFGTQFEDLGVAGIQALADIENYAKLDSAALDEINAVKYDTPIESLQTLGRTLQIF